MARDFSDQSYIDNYNEKKEYPKIHENFMAMVTTYANENEPCFDLGTNIGILAVQLVDKGRSLCVGIEGGKDFDRAIQHPKVVYEKMYITEETLPRLEELLIKYKPTLIAARRVLSELSFDPNTVGKVAEMFHRHGVKKIVLEGRVPVPNPQVKLWNSELEVEALSEYYLPTKKYKAVYLLCRK